MVKEPAKRKPILLYALLFIFALAGVAVYFILTNSTISNRFSLYRCYWDAKIVTTPGTTKTGVQPINILPGQDPLAVGKLLQEKGVITNANDFLCYVSKIKAGNQIQAGYYEIQLPITIEQLVPFLQSARVPTFRVTLPEGLRYDEIATKIDTAMGNENAQKQFSVEEFNKLAVDRAYLDAYTYTKNKPSLEGFLFPDTYEIAKNVSAKDVMDLLTKTFIRKVSDETELDNAKTLTPYQTIVLASIVEKEAGKSFEEKQTVAGILLKRMRNDWLLQVDATFLYEKKDWKAPIYAQDKLSNSLYNTYKRMGLPPTPICNPGLDSIRAVLQPVESQYWYYLHGTDGKIRYAQTNEEHLRNISLYLR